MLMTSSIELAKPRKSGVGVSDSSCLRRDRSEVNGGEVNSGEVKDNEIGNNVQKTSKSKNLSRFKKTLGSDFFIFGAKLVFTELS